MHNQGPARAQVPHSARGRLRALGLSGIDTLSRDDRRVGTGRLSLGKRARMSTWRSSSQRPLGPLGAVAERPRAGRRGIVVAGAASSLRSTRSCTRATKASCASSRVCTAASRRRHTSKIAASSGSEYSTLRRQSSPFRSAKRKQETECMAAIASAAARSAGGSALKASGHANHDCSAASSISCANMRQAAYSAQKPLKEWWRLDEKNPIMKW
eukprot:scaffold38270_cov61-Phaeocystis_antarctica.AAC.6